MGGSAYRYETEDDQLSAAIYWRRRFLALVAGIAILGIIAWTCSGALGGGTGKSVADVGHAGKSSPAPAHGTPAPAVPSPGAPDPGTDASGQPASQPGAVPPCPPRDVVLSVFEGQGSYAPGQPPAFSLAVVSTAGATCSFNVGPRFLSLVITAAGTRVWGSGDCAAAPGSLVTSLVRGVPTILPVTWDLQTSAPGCRAAQGQAGAGSYAATASAGGESSNTVTFTLG